MTANSDEAKLKRRRELHRESMRRHRQRQAEGIVHMQATRAQLAQQLLELSRLAAANPQLMQDYRELAQTSRRLQEEQLQLHRSILGWKKAKTQLAVCMAYHPQMVTPIPTRLLQDLTEARPLQFQALSETGIQQVIRRCCVNLRQREQRLRLTSTPPSKDAGANTNFGWSVKSDLSNESDVFMSLTKRLPGVTARHVMACAWEKADNPALYPHMGPASHDVVQVVPERAYVVVRDMQTYGQLCDWKHRSCMMCFKVCTDRGYAVAMSTVAPDQCPKGGKKGVFVEFSSWTEVADDIDGCCVLTVSYHGQYNTGEQPHRRFVNLLSSVRRFEDFVLDRPLTLLQ